jgi:hyperosmotically inducible protein
MRRAVLMINVGILLVCFGCNSQAVDDSGVTAKVKAKFASDSIVSAIEIGVETKDGVVTLTGKVPTQAEKSEAQKVALTADGVKRVVNNVVIDPNSLGASNTDQKLNDLKNKVAANATDDGIQAKIKSKLLVAGIKGVTVDVSARQVTLSGSVKDAQTKAEAELLAKNTDGVTGVASQLSLAK